jgi:hypothetical protein
MHKINNALTAQAMTWPVMISNGSLVCARMVEDGNDSWCCWVKLVDAADGPGELTEFSAAALAARVIRHVKEFHLTKA